MSELLLTSQPGFTELLASSLVTGTPLTSTLLKAINDNARFACVRTETFYGYYLVGESVLLPTSPADGYEYSAQECRFLWSLYWSGSGQGPLVGVTYLPTRGVTSQPGWVLQMGFTIDQNTGLISGGVSYWTGSQQLDTTDGILMVVTIAKRAR